MVYLQDWKYNLHLYISVGFIKIATLSEVHNNSEVEVWIVEVWRRWIPEVEG
jgi:hypothetical protein